MIVNYEFVLGAQNFKRTIWQLLNMGISWKRKWKWKWKHKRIAFSYCHTCIPKWCDYGYHTTINKVEGILVQRTHVHILDRIIIILLMWTCILCTK